MSDLENARQEYFVIAPTLKQPIVAQNTNLVSKI